MRESEENMVRADILQELNSITNALSVFNSRLEERFSSLTISETDQDKVELMVWDVLATLSDVKGLL